MELTLDDIRRVVEPKRVAEEKIIKEIDSFVDASRKIHQEVSPVNPKSKEWIEAVTRLLSTLLEVSKPKESHALWEEYDQRKRLGQVRDHASELMKSLQ